MTTTARTPARTSGQSKPVTLSSKKRPQGSILLTLLTSLMALYALVPLAWLLINSTKTQEGLFSSFGLWFDDGKFALFSNIADTFTYDGGVFTRWLANTLLYVVVGAGGATFLAVLAGYGLAKFNFAGKKAIFNIILAGVLVPGVILAIPQYLLLAQVGLTNTYWSVLLPSIISPYGIYLARIYAAASVPDDVLEAARTDGAGEARIFTRIAVPMMLPGLVTVFLFQFVAIWNNYMLPFIMLGNDRLFPITVGLSGLLNQGASQPAMYTQVITGALLSIIPLIALFLLLQRHWKVDLAAGAVKA